MVRAGDRAADQQEVPGAGGGYQRPVGVPGPLGAVSARTALEDRIPQGLLRLDHLPRGQGDPEVAGGDPDVRQTAFLACLAEPAAAGTDLIEGDPPGGHPHVQQPLQLLAGQLRLGLVPQLARDACRAAPPPVLLPALRHEHVEIGPGLPGRGHPDGVHGGDAVLDVPCAPGMLRRDARGRVTVLELGGLVERDSRPDQVARIVRQPGQRERGQLGPQVLPAPPAGAQQGLHPVRVLVPGSLGKLPAVRLHSRRQPPHVVRRRRDGAALRHHPPEHRADLRVHSRRAVPEITYAGLCGRVVTVCCHTSGNAARPFRITAARSG